MRVADELSGICRSGMHAEQVAGAARALGGRALAALCRRLATDYRHAHSGFPDLTLWNTRTNKVRYETDHIFYAHLYGTGDGGSPTSRWATTHHIR